MATSHERMRWKEQIIRDHPYMANLPGAVDCMIDMYCSDKKSFDKLVEECKRMEADPNAKSTILPEVITYGIRKGEPEVRQSDDVDSRLSIEELPTQPVERRTSQSGDDAEQPPQDPDP